MSVFKWKDMSRTRGGRISQRGFRLTLGGLAGIFIGGLAAGAARAPGPVIWAVIGAMFVMMFGGLAVVYAGHRIDNHALADYHRRVAAGEEPAWKPGDPNPLA
jgi:hypothetical protein